MGGETAVRPDGPVRTIATAATHPALAARARDLAVQLRAVERAEAVYTRYHVDLSRDGASLWRTVTARRRRQEAAAAFNELVGAVGALRISWELFCLNAFAEQLTTRAALRRALPGLFEGGGRVGTDEPPGSAPGDLRRDTTFSYVGVATAGDIAECFRRRLESGYC